MTLRDFLYGLCTGFSAGLIALSACSPTQVEQAKSATLLGCDMVEGLDAETVALVWHVPADKVRVLQASCGAAKLVCDVPRNVAGAAGVAGTGSR